MNYGEFVDAMREVAEINTDANLYFGRWLRMATEEKWKEYRNLPLDHGKVENFIDDMEFFVQEALNFTDGEELYCMRAKDGHDFMNAINKKCRELDIDVS